MTKRTVILTGPLQRQTAAQYLKDALDGWVMTLAEPKRKSDQNAKFHAICGDIARSGLAWGGKPRTGAQWKVLMVSGHAVATKEGADMVPGVEGEFVNLRESTALMSVKRSASLIEYTLAFAAMHDVKLIEPLAQEP